MIFHFVGNYATGIFLCIFKVFDQLAGAWGIEILLAVVVIAITLIIFKYWLPRVDNRLMAIQKNDDQQE